MQADPATEPRARRRLEIRGAVQGVGFRPFVWREARRLGLSGWVRNSAAGVTVEAEGCPDRLARLVEALRHAAPSPARVTGIAEAPRAPTGARGFAIRESEAAGPGGAQVLPDLATCDACLAELCDPGDRRHRYPFVNCTACGPRYSIVEALPYDRERTSMRRFPMCPACRAEYDDPSGRRFHAEPNACPDCGPRLALHAPDGEVLARDDAALRAAVAALRQGAVLAVKGIGGVHLVTDACDGAAVARLRARKRRGEKPFAVMVADLAAARESCRVEPAAAALLTGPERPVVLLPWTGGPVAEGVAPGCARLGLMLPHAPLHHLMLGDFGGPLVATSGNLSGAPIATGGAEALRRLSGVADLFLLHDRPILRPLDDSVAQIVCGGAQVLRRGRGYAPAPVAVPVLAEGLLAVGGHLKAAVAVATPAGAVLGQHLGDLDTGPARAGHAAALADLPRLHGVTPRAAVCDLHPDYPSTPAAAATGLPVVAVQHHLAHAAACLAEHGLAPPALAICWDGTGHGPDGTVWGGEGLHLTGQGWRRVARLRPFRLPGVEAAVREPRRAALGLLHAAFGDAALERTDLAPVAAFRPEERRVLAAMLKGGTNAPVTSSAGRLFDAVAALCGLCQRSGYEGQAAARLEAAAGPADPGAAYAVPLRDEGGPCLEIDWRPALAALLGDLRAGAGTATVSARFHDGLAAAILALARHVGAPRVALSGGCFQNVRLTEAAVAALSGAGFAPLWHAAVPPNDGGLALGQLAWASWAEREGETACASRCPDGS